MATIPNEKDFSGTGTLVVDTNNTETFKRSFCSSGKSTRNYREKTAVNR